MMFYWHLFRLSIFKFTGNKEKERKNLEVSPQAKFNILGSLKNKTPYYKTVKNVFVDRLAKRLAVHKQ